MKTAIFYRSMTGHSKKIAKTIGTEFAIEPQNIKKNPQVEGVDLAFIIGGIYSGKSLPDMVDFAKTLTPEKVKAVALITSSAMDKVGQDEVRAILERNGIKVLDEYRCLGNFLFMKFKHPTKDEIAGAVTFAKKISEGNVRKFMKRS